MDDHSTCGCRQTDELLALIKKRKARRFVRSGKRINASNKIDHEGQILDDRRMAKLRDREWLLSEAFGY
jgi:hypothetical protein